MNGGNELPRKKHPNEKIWYQLTCDECGAELDDVTQWGMLFDSPNTAREIAANDCAWQITPEHDYCPKHWHVECVLCRNEYHGAYDGLADWKLSIMSDSLCPQCLRELAIADLAEKRGETGERQPGRWDNRL